ncbi:MAG: hypothetical protein CME70_22490 [Halobacteriovorax sp.]|nr:hypothetical protein [Halobacteriovorax sp.]|tara:strand:- start:73836 stop:74663 length:828 start_codon:yes stop_codon:yes gene_type:complete
MKVFVFLIGITLFSNAYASAELEEAIKGFNKVASSATEPKFPCQERRVPPKQARYEEGVDASKLHEKVDLGFKKEFETSEYRGDSLSVLSPEEAEKLFKAFYEVDYMQFDYLHAGCEIRAHEYALIAKANGIKMGKAMTMYGTEIDRGGLYPKEWKEKDKAGEKIPVPDGFIGWRYHVAPYVLVKDGDKIKPYVFDMGIAKKPKTLKQWNSSLKNMDEKETRTFTKGSDFLHPYDESPREPGKSFIGTELNKQKLIREMGIYEFEYWDSKGLLSY